MALHQGDMSDVCSQELLRCIGLPAQLSDAMKNTEFHDLTLYISHTGKK
jgi:hypothetical protein